MLSVAERHKYILDHLNKYGFVRITDVANELGVTKVTIRKDVKILEAKGLLYKVHGSARSANPHVADTDVHVKGNVNREEKERIARKAVELLNDNDSIIMASGSTIYAFAEAIKREFRSHLNVVTTFLKTSVLLNDVEEINVVQLGGCVHKKSLSAIGGYAEAALSDFSCSKLFFGVDGIDLEHGITTSTIEEAKLTQVMMRSASKIIILADSSKFGQRGFGRICSLEEVDVIVTDSRIDLLENKVALAVPEGNPKNITSYDELAAGLQDGTVFLAMGNADVPVGQYTQKIFACYGLDEEALANAGVLTYGTNVKEVTTQVSEAAVDCGIIYATDAFSAGLTVVGSATAEMCGQVIYPAAVLKGDKEDAARAFLAYLQTDAAMTVFESVGFSPAI